MHVARASTRCAGYLPRARTLAPSTESRMKPVTNRTGMAGGLRASCHLNYGRFAVTLPSSGTLITVALATTWTYCRKPRNGNSVLQDGARKNCRAFLGKRRETVVTSRESSYANETPAAGIAYGLGRRLRGRQISLTRLSTTPGVERHHCNGVERRGPDHDWDERRKIGFTRSCRKLLA